MILSRYYKTDKTLKKLFILGNQLGGRVVALWFVPLVVGFALEVLQPHLASPLTLEIVGLQQCSSHTAPPELHLGDCGDVLNDLSG